MPSWTLLLAAGVDAAIALFLAYVGLLVLRKHPPTPGGLRASRAFATWWLGLSFTVLGNAAKEAAAGFSVESLPGVVALLDLTQYAYVAALVAAVAGLLYYLLFLFTGNGRWFWPLVAFYSVYGAAALALLASLAPSGVTAGKWFVQWSYANPSPNAALLGVMSLLLLLPQIGAAIAYATLYRRVDSAEARYRIALVSGSLLVWLGLTLVAPFLQLGRFEAWQAGGRLVGLAAALVILAAYAPPRPIRERLAAREVA